MGAGRGGAGAGGGGAGAERRGAARGRAQKPSRRRRAGTARSCPRSRVFIEMQIVPRLPFSPPGKRGAGGACRPRVGPSGFGGLGEGGSAEGDSQEGGQATRSLGRSHGGGTLEFGDTLYLSRENGRISENATRAPTGGEAA